MRDPILLESGFGFNNGNSHVTASFSPTANRLVLALLYVRQDGQNPPASPTLTGNGLTWTLVGSASIHEAKVCIYRAVGAAPSTGALTIDLAVSGHNDVGWIVIECPDAAISGTNGADAILQYAINTSSSATGITVNLATFLSSRSMTLGLIAYPAGASGITSGAGFTPIVELSTVHDVQAQYKKSPDTSVDWTIGGTVPDICAIAVEIKTRNRGIPLSFLR